MKNNITTRWYQWLVLGLSLYLPLHLSGCSTVGLLGSPSVFERKVPPAFDLLNSQDQKVLVWVECPKSLDTDHRLQQKLALTMSVYMTEKMTLSPENIIQKPNTLFKRLSVDPVLEARRKGAGYLLLVQVDDFDLSSLQIRQLYSGHLITRSVLLDTQTGKAVWPQQPKGKMIHTAVEMESGRDVVQSLLISGTAHCILRYLYPCEKMQFKHSTERISTQEVFELETY